MSNYQDFFEFYRQTEKEPEPTAAMYTQLEDLARQTLGRLHTGAEFKRPREVAPIEWAQAEEVFGYAAHTLVDQQQMHVLGFVPLVIDVMYGYVERIHFNGDSSLLQKTLAQQYVHPVEVHALWIDQDTLENANPKELHQLLLDLHNRQEPDSMWNHPERLECEQPQVRTFYLPVIFTLPAELLQDETWTSDQAYEQTEQEVSSQEMQDALSALIEIEGDAHVQMQELEVGDSQDSMHLGQTQRDLREIISRLEMMKNDVLQQDNQEHEWKMEIQLTWGALKGEVLEDTDIPAIRFSATARTTNELLPRMMVMGLHVDPRRPHQWPELVGQLLKACYAVGWPQVQVRQYSATEALQYWGARTIQ